MVSSVTSLGRSGVYDWLIQRVTAVIIAAYFILVMGFLLTHSPLAYEDWFAFITCTPMQIFSLLAFVATAAHAWIGLWTISTDYIKHSGLRLAFQLVCALAILACFIWAIMILWGI